MREKPIDITVVVPTHNRPRGLQCCLEALSTATLEPERFEIIVVDDGSAEKTVSDTIARAEGRLNIRLLNQSRSGPAAARNHGARHARGALLAFTDDDCRPQPAWLSAMLKAHGDVPGAMIGGQTRNGLPDNIFSEASQLLITYLYEAYRRPDGTPRFFTSNNLAVPTDAFKAVGGFDERFPGAAGEDRELCHRWFTAGHSMRLEPAAVVEHHCELSTRRFLLQHFNYGRAAHAFCRLCIEHGSERPAVEPGRFYLDMLAYPWRAIEHPRPMTLAALVFLSQAMNVLGYFCDNLPFVMSLAGPRPAPGDGVASKV